MRWNNNRFFCNGDSELMKKVSKELVKSRIHDIFKSKIRFTINNIRGRIDENLPCHLSNLKLSKVLKDDLELDYKYIFMKAVNVSFEILEIIRAINRMKLLKLIESTSFVINIDE